MHEKCHTAQLRVKVLLLWIVVAATCCACGLEASQRLQALPDRDNGLATGYFILLLGLHTGISLLLSALSLRLEDCRRIGDLPVETRSRTTKTPKYHFFALVIGAAFAVFASVLFVWAMRVAVGALVSLATPIPLFTALNIVVISSKRLSYVKAGRLKMAINGKYSWVRLSYLTCVAVGLVLILMLGPGPKLVTVGVVVAMFVWDAMVPDLQIYEHLIVVRRLAILPWSRVTEFRWNEFIPAELVIVASDRFRTSISIRPKDKPALTRLVQTRS